MKLFQHNFAFVKLYVTLPRLDAVGWLVHGNLSLPGPDSLDGCLGQYCVSDRGTRLKIEIVTTRSVCKMWRRAKSYFSTSRDEGKFTCIASNKAGESRRSVQLVVKVSRTQ